MSFDAKPTSIPRQFPALQRLIATDDDAVLPFIAQQSPVENSAACLAIVLEYFGRKTSVDEIFMVVQSQRDPSSENALLATARHLELRARRVRVDLDRLQFAEPGTLLKWGEQYVVLENVHRGVLDIVHPGRGRLSIPMREARKEFSGIGVELGLREARGKPLPKAVGALWVLFRRHLGDIASVISASLLLQLLALSIPILTALIVDRIVPRQDANLLTVTGGGVAVMTLFYFCSSLARQYAMIPLKAQVSRELGLGFYDHLVDLPYAFFQKHSSGDVLVRASANDRIRSFAASGASSLMIDGATALLYFIALGILSFKMALVVAVFVGVHLVVLVTALRQISPVAAGLIRAEAKSQGGLVEMLTGLQQVKEIGAEDDALERWSHRFVSHLERTLEQARIFAYSNASADALNSLAPLAVLLIGASLVLGDQLSLGVMLGGSALAVGFILPITTLSKSLVDLKVLGAHVQLLDEVRVLEPEQDPETVSPARRLRGNVQLEQVSFRYPASSEPALRGVSLDVRSGEFVAIVGESGSGKSTLARLMVGLYLPSSGKVVFDGEDLARLDLRSVRRQIGVVPQVPFLLQGSIRENIALGHHGIGFDRIVEAARLAHLHDYVLTLPMGYETQLAEGGNGFSGGQKQRIALARALAHRPAFVLLDEATSALDNESERAIQQNLESLHCTRIVIAHRLSTIRNADRIVVMDNGSIVEIGSHDELVAKGEYYARLVSTQLSY